MISLLEDSFLHLYMHHRICIKLPAKQFCPLAERLTLYAFLDRCHVGSILCMVSNTLEAGMLPSVFLLVLGKISSLCLFIIRCFLPYHPVADFIEQQSVVILLHEIFQILVVSRQF